MVVCASCGAATGTTARGIFSAGASGVFSPNCANSEASMAARTTGPLRVALSFSLRWIWAN